MHAERGIAPEGGEDGLAALRRHAPTHWRELFQQAKDVGDVDIHACADSMEMFELSMDDLDPLVDGVCGVASFFGAADGLARELDAHVQRSATHRKLVIFAWSGDLDRIWPTFILATTAAAMGMRTIVFFTFWGLFPLVRNDVRVTGDNWMQRMMSLLHRGGTDHLHLSQMDFAGMGAAMMRKLADEHHVASPQELLEVARDLGVELIPCGMTMDLLGLEREDLIEGLAEPAGATTALAEAQDAVTLFV